MQLIVALTKILYPAVQSESPLELVWPGKLEVRLQTAQCGCGCNVGVHGLSVLVCIMCQCAGFRWFTNHPEDKQKRKPPPAGTPTQKQHHQETTMLKIAFIFPAACSLATNSAQETQTPISVKAWSIPTKIASKPVRYFPKNISAQLISPGHVQLSYGIREIKPNSDCLSRDESSLIQGGTIGVVKLGDNTADRAEIKLYWRRI